MVINVHTKYAPAERASEDEIKKQYTFLKNIKDINVFLNKIPVIFIIVNEFRQVVYMNEGAMHFIGLEDYVEVVGKRPGEIFSCIHSSEEEGGCGTSLACTYCGAVNAVLLSIEGKPTVQDCRLILGPDEKSYDLRVWATPLPLKGGMFHAVSIQNIENEKRRGAFERIFYHDLLNTISGLYSTIQILKDHGDKVDKEQFIKKIFDLTKVIIDEIKSQQLIIEAESNTLQLNVKELNTLDFLKELIDLFKNQEIFEERHIIIDDGSKDIKIKTDKIILRRILENMIKNAIEAT